MSNRPLARNGRYRGKNVYVFDGPTDVRRLSDLDLRGCTIVFNGPYSLADLKDVDLKDACLIINPHGPSAENVPPMLNQIRNSLGDTNTKVEAIKSKRMRQNEPFLAEEEDIEEGAATHEGRNEIFVEETNAEPEEEVEQEEDDEVADDDQSRDQRFYDAEDGQDCAMGTESEVEGSSDGEEGQEGQGKDTQEVDDSLTARARRVGFFLISGK